MLRVRTVLSGWSGGPGLATFYFDSADVTQPTIQALVNRVRAYFLAIAPLHTIATSFAVDSEVAEIDPATGQQTAAHVAAVAPLVVVGSGGSAISPPSTMILLRLLTSRFVLGRKLQGHSNVGPVSSTSLQGDGSPLEGSRTTLVNAGVGLADVGGASPDLLVWSRPTLTRIGSIGTVVGVSVPDKFAVLRSRRD